MRITLVLLLTLAPIAAFAQTAPSAPGTAPFTIDDAVDLAIKQNPRLSAATRDISAARAGLRSARALSNPDLTFIPGTPGGSDSQFLLQQPLELNGTRGARTGVASAQLRQVQAQATAELRELVYDTESAYIELARSREQALLAHDLLSAAVEFDRLAHRQVELGKRPGIEVVQTEIEVTRASQQLTLSESQAKIAQATLNTLMGRTPEEPIAALLPLPVTAESPDPEATLRQALARRTEIEAQEAAAEGFRQQARLAHAQGLPDVVPQLRAGSLTRGLRDAGIGVGITLPFIDYGSRRNQVRQAEEAARAQTYRVSITRAQVRQEVSQALARLDSARVVVESYRAGVLDQSRRLLDASRVGFQEGQTSLIAVLEAQRTYRSVQTDYNNALADLARARTDLSRATGAFPSDLLPNTQPTGTSH